MLSTNKLSQHTFGQSKPGKPDTLSQHAVAQMGYPSMQSAFQNPGKLDLVSQHAVEANHRLGKLDMLSQHTQHKHTIPAYIAQINLYKRTADKLTQQCTVQLEEQE